MTVFRRPWRIPRRQLEAALRFEFELKIDGQSLARSSQAICAFALDLSLNGRYAAVLH